MTQTARIALIGTEGAASQLAAVLVAAGAELVDSISEANVVLSSTSPVLALKTARESSDALADGAIYADLNAGTPGLKRSLAEAFPTGAFADVVIADSRAESFAIAVSGTGSAALAELLAPLVAVEVISDVAGQAAARALLRSMLDNSMATVLVDTLWAAESLGQATWMHEEILRVFETSTGETAQSLLADTSVNFKRRQMDMQDVVELLSESGYESTMLAPIQFTHGRIMHSKKIPHAKG